MSEMKTRRPLSRRYSRRQPASGTRKIRKDGWGNLITGLNAASIAKKVHTRHTLDVLLSDEELESIYIDDGLGARIVNLLPGDMFREGWNYTFPDMDGIKAAELEDKYKEAMETIEAQQKIKEAVQWARLYGGSVILIGALDGRTMDKPLDPKKIKTDGLEKLRVIDRSDIDFQEIQFQLDPAKPRYGLPEYYPIKSQGKDAVSNVTLVHHSRIIEIHGDRLPSGATRTLTPEQRYWGISVLQHVDDHLKTLGASMGALTNSFRK
jgi:phage-related protein (TIGR01555 family)